MSVSMYISYTFFVFQAILMLLVAYSVNGALVSNFEKEEDGCSKIILVGSTLLFSGASITWLIF
jgi:hypothetical protein